MRNTRLTSVLTLLCVPLLLAAAALGPLAVMEQTDRARLETAHSLPAPADIGAPNAQAMEIPFHIFQRPVDPLRVGGGAHKIRDAAACENIIDLSHGQNLLPRFLQHIQHGIPGGH